MKIFTIWLAVFLILFSSAGAFYGGYHLVGHPDGSSLKLSLELLKHTPFKTYLIPGILLFITIGVFGLVVIVMTLFQVTLYQKLIIASGLFLTMWLLVQMALIKVIAQWQYIMLFVGIATVLCGVYLDRDPVTNKKTSNK